jgi:activator of HSP90 ATPase
MCKPVHHEVEFNAKPKDVYDAYLDSRRHARITGMPASMSRKEGGYFTAGGDYISGYNLELIPSRRIVQAWRGSDWEEGEYSILRLQFRARGKRTRLIVDHIGIPDDQREGVDKGWYEFYWDPMKAYFSPK